MKKNSEVSKLFVPFLIINVSSDMVCDTNNNFFLGPFANESEEHFLQECQL